MLNAQRALRGAVFSTLTILCAHNAHAAWLADGTSLANAALGSLRSAAVPNGAGGAIVVWRDFRNFNHDIYAQRIDGSGNVLWGAGGVAVCTAAGTQEYPALVSDGLGGAIITWHDQRSGNNDVYAQRISAMGVAMWTANGIAICVQPGSQLQAQIASDGSGGAVITWMDVRVANYDIYVQRVNAAGAIQWLANGINICNAANDQSNPVIIADGVGGTIVSWFDYRSGTEDIYVQRVASSGMASWTNNGVLLTVSLPSTQWYPSLVSDGAGGAIVAWSDLRNGAYDIFASRIDANGLYVWSSQGNSVTSAAGQQGGAFAPSIVADGAGGAIVTWHDSRDGIANHIYAQRMSPFGTALWTPDGIPVCTAADAQGYPTLISDGSGGAVVAFHTATGAFSNAFAQHLNASGVSQWAVNGLELAPAPGNQEITKIVSDGAGGAIVAWEDTRAGASRMYAQRIETRHGFWGRPEPNVDAVADIPNDQGGKVKVNWDASDHDVFGQSVTHYSIWRATDEASARAAMANGVPVRRPAEVPQHAPVDYYWEWVGNQDAHNRAHYTFSADTRSDSTVQNNGDAAFFVSAHTADPTVFFDSNVMIGHSVDNLAPAAPLALIAQRVGADVLLHWNRVRVSDLRNYTVYRATSSGVTAIPVNFLSSSVDTVAVDAGVPGSALYYIVTATDVHDNQGAASNEASVAATTDAGGAPSIRALTVLQNYPNPFAGSTELSIGLPAAADVSIEIYDVAGRRVRSQTFAGRGAGWQRISIDGRDDDQRPLASGVYFYRVSAHGSTVTRKMVLAR